MLEFKVMQELEANNEILNIIKNCTFTTKNGRVKHLLKTNLQFIEPTEYLITYPTTTLKKIIKSITWKKLSKFSQNLKIFKIFSYKPLKNSF